MRRRGASTYSGQLQSLQAQTTLAKMGAEWKSNGKEWGESFLRVSAQQRGPNHPRAPSRCRTPKSLISSARGCCSPGVAPSRRRCSLPSRSLAAGWGCSLPSTGQLSTCGLFLQEVAFLEMMPVPDPC